MGDQIEEKALYPPKLRQGYLLILVFLLMLGILLVGWLPKQLYFNINVDTYISLHMILMVYSIVVSLTVFIAGLFDYRQSKGLRELILCATFFMVGTIDLIHTISYPGMPDFMTMNTLNKSTTLWIYSRIIEAGGLVLAVLINPVRKKKVNLYLISALIIFVTGLIIWGVVYKTLPAPLMFNPESGQTFTKVFLDYIVIFLKGAALYHLIKLKRNYLADYYLQAALIFGIFSEAAFTLYNSAFDTYNFLGHVYKIFEFACIMISLFVLSVVRLHQTNKVLENQKQQMAQINAKLEKANKLKSDYFANTNHELRTPLTAIIAFTELLRDKETGPLNEVQKDYINEINESSQQLLNYINNILDLAKIEAGKIEMNYEPLEIRELFINMKRKMEPIFKVKEQHISYDVEDKLPIVNADSRKLEHILINLLSNAHKYTPEGGSIEVRAHMSKAKDKIIISVADNGMGISEQHKKIIFEKFKQVNDTTGIHPGTGLGLTLVKELVSLHGGQISVESTPGKGSNFSFSLPLNL